MNLSKSRYTLGVTCPKYLWLSCYKKEEATDLDNDGSTDNSEVIIKEYEKKYSDKIKYYIKQKEGGKRK